MMWNSVDSRESFRSEDGFLQVWMGTVGPFPTVTADHTGSPHILHTQHTYTRRNEGAGRDLTDM